MKACLARGASFFNLDEGVCKDGGESAGRNARGEDVFDGFRHVVQNSGNHFYAKPQGKADGHHQYSLAVDLG